MAYEINDEFDFSNNRIDYRIIIIDSDPFKDISKLKSFGQGKVDKIKNNIVIVFEKDNPYQITFANENGRTIPNDIKDKAYEAHDKIIAAREKAKQEAKDSEKS